MGNICNKNTAEMGQVQDKHESNPYNDQIPLVDGQPKSDSDPLPRLKNIHATPLELKQSFAPPVNKKSPSETKFLQSALKDNFIFANLGKNEVTTLIAAFENHRADSGTKIIEQGEAGDYFYVVQEGQVEFFVNEQKVADAGSGKGFGDLALLYNSPRAATCVAVQDCSLWKVDQNTFRQILANNTITTDKEIKDVLKKVPFLENLDECYLSQMAYAATPEFFTTGETIVTKGEPGEKFYVVKEGKVVVRDIEVGGKKFDDQVGEEYFGERAIVQDEPRAANIVALEDTVTLSLSRDVFLKVLGPLKDLIIRSNDLRKLKGLLAFSRSDVNDSELKNLTSLIKDVKVAAKKTIFHEGASIDGAVYIVRSGSVTVTSTTLPIKTITQGGTFGETHINTEKFVAQGTAVADEDCVLGVLTEKKIYSVIRDRSRLYNPLARPEEQEDTKAPILKLDDLEKHHILGVGTFGKVWLVSNKGASQPEAYALKIQRKRQLLDQSQVDGVYREMQIMSSLNHPFIIKMVNAYQDAETVMMLLVLVQGGELFSLMKKSKRRRLGESNSCFYAAGILEALSYMHHRNILYRDLKPENVLIDKDGYPVIVDLGFAKIVPDKTFTLCGTPWYIAPEVILGRGHDKGCDLWSFAVMLHEMICSITPFNDYGTDQMTLFKAIVNGRMKIMKMSPEACDFIKRILVTKPSLRLGCLAGGDLDLKNHKFFSQINFNEILEKKVVAPWTPKFKDALDSSEFDNWNHMNVVDKDKPLTSAEQKKFRKFESLCL